MVITCHPRPAARGGSYHWEWAKVHVRQPLWGVGFPLQILRRSGPNRLLISNEITPGTYWGLITPVFWSLLFFCRGIRFTHQLDGRGLPQDDDSTNHTKRKVAFTWYLTFVGQSCYSLAGTSPQQRKRARNGETAEKIKGNKAPCVAASMVNNMFCGMRSLEEFSRTLGGSGTWLPTRWSSSSGSSRLCTCSTTWGGKAVALKANNTRGKDEGALLHAWPRPLTVPFPFIPYIFLFAP